MKLSFKGHPACRAVLSGAVSALSVAGSSTMARAQTADWVQPATDLFGDLEVGLVDIGAVIVGIGIIANGIYATATGKLQFEQLAFRIIGGLMIVAGPAAIRALLS